MTLATHRGPVVFITTFVTSPGVPGIRLAASLRPLAERFAPWLAALVGFEQVDPIGSTFDGNLCKGEMP